MTSVSSIGPANAVRPTPPTREKASRVGSPDAAPSAKQKDSFTSTFKQVSSAIEAGDLTAAKDALDQMGARGPAYTRATPPGRGPAQTPEHSNSRWNRQIEFQALVDAVRGESLTSAQDALTALRTPGLQTPAAATPPTTPEATPPVDTPVDTPVDGTTPVTAGDGESVVTDGVPADLPTEDPTTVPPAATEESAPAEAAPSGELTEQLSAALAGQPIADASLVELLTESPTAEPTE
jgi:hypothetical protein